MTATVANYRWNAGEFVGAWEASVFDSRAELVEGEVWPVAMGDWPGEAVGRVILALGSRGLRPTTSMLPSGTSLPDPDCWVRRDGANPTGTLGRRLSTWAPDVLLVVGMSDETLMADLTIKARVDGAAAWPVYWVVSPEVVYVHTDPHASGDRQRVEYRSGEQVALPFAEDSIAVDDLVG
ncbi:Uma2 family endonuclease [uncultured Friedmanniella sp.]|uniref:Uma2 family endonuclease n=1 Tax=uncultured Friedmanniella sp. TaxID=335381 RepID=UPI0035CB478B